MARETDSYQNVKSGWSIPFEECAIDLIGPWTLKVCGKPYEFKALTAIGTVLNIIELVRNVDKESNTVARKFSQCWLTCYPWLQNCIHDPGTEFLRLEFQILSKNCHIRDVCTNANNHRLTLCVKQCIKRYKIF
jgi:hypothetical protein